jgi:hypothetical protein
MYWGNRPGYPQLVSSILNSAKKIGIWINMGRRPRRIDLALLCIPSSALLELLFVVLVFSADFPQFRWTRCHLVHRPVLLDGELAAERVDDDGEDDDCRTVSLTQRRETEGPRRGTAR